MPVAAFYDIQPPLRRLVMAKESLVTLPVLDSSRQIECNQGEAGLAFYLIFKTEDVLMPFGACLQLEPMVTIDVFVIDLHMPVTTIVRASQSL